MRPRWIVVCNFAEFLIYDMETLAKPTKILLDELPEKFHALDFLVDKSKNKLRIELELSLKAGEIVGKLYDALHEQYLNPDNEHSLASLNKLCVRLVFCLYAESAGIFGKHKIFRDYLQKENNIRRGLLDLFDVLNTPIDARDPYLDDTLKNFRSSMAVCSPILSKSPISRPKLKISYSKRQVAVLTGLVFLQLFSARSLRQR